MNIIRCFVCNFLTTLRLFPIKTDFLLPFSFWISRNLREKKKPRKQTLDMTRYKENPRIACNKKKLKRYNLKLVML
jgi:hypothetical protein